MKRLSAKNQVLVTFKDTAQIQVDTIELSFIIKNYRFDSLKGFKIRSLSEYNY